jgi:ATPase subunit of ABC transporter with duplicated ATPase domains
LDEPTNNLDIETIEAIQELLLEYRGGLIVISHDINFIKNLKIDRFYEVDGILKPVMVS